MLLDKGVDLHSYQPSADDMVKISKCDLFVYVGGESDAWVDDALKSAQNKNMKVINLLDVLGNSVKEEEQVEGMQAEEEEKRAKRKVLNMMNMYGFLLKMQKLFVPQLPMHFARLTQKMQMNIKRI